MAPFSGSNTSMTPRQRTRPIGTTYRCDECSKTFHRPSLLEEHKNKHSGLRPYTCDFAECNAKFMTRDTLRSHAATHGPGVTCSHCGNRFSRDSSLRRHGKTCCGNALEEIQSTSSDLSTSIAPQGYEGFNHLSPNEEIGLSLDSDVISVTSAPANVVFQLPSIESQISTATRDPDCNELSQEGFFPQDQHCKAWRDAAEVGHVPTILDLLEYVHVDTIVDDLSGKRALHITAEKGHLHALLALLNANATVDAKDSSGRTALLIAVHMNFPLIARELANRGADMLNTADKYYSPIVDAIRKRHDQILTFFLQRLDDANVVIDDQPLIHLVSQYSDSKHLAFLFDRGGNILLRNGQGETTLHRACAGSNIACVRLILKRIDLVHEKDSEGRTPAHSLVNEGARKENAAECLQLLDENGVNLRELYDE